MPRSPVTRISRVPLTASLLAAAGFCASLSAQTPDAPAPNPGAPLSSSPPPTYYVQTEVADITGRDFARVQLPVSLKIGDISIRASRCSVWTEGGTNTRVVGPDGLPVGTQRLLLQGDVVIDLGDYHFTSAQAVVWSQNLGSVSADNAVPSNADVTASGFGQPPASSVQALSDTDRQVRQIAVYFDRVSDPGAQAGFAQAADRLLVTGRFDGTFSLKVDTITPGRPATPATPPAATTPPMSAAATAQAAFLDEGEKRWQKYLRDLIGKPDGESFDQIALPSSTASDIINPGLSRPYEPNSPIARRHTVAKPAFAEIPIEDRTEPLFAKDGLVTFAVGTQAPNAASAPDFGEPAPGLEGTPSNNFVRIVRGEKDDTVILTGGIALQYTDLRKTRNLFISAQRAVVFLPPGPLTDVFKFSAGHIRGIYLEGDVVATDGQYTLRGPRVFYDFAQNQAVMADAVFSTVDAKLGVPIYVRAQTLRQEAANQVHAEGARLSTSSFSNRHRHRSRRQDRWRAQSHGR
jgi:hypothetical protein